MSAPDTLAPGPEAMENYVRYSLDLLGVALAPEARARVAATFANNARIARACLDFPLPAEVEPAPRYDPSWVEARVGGDDLGRD